MRTTKKLMKTFEVKARELVSQYNPYVKRSIRYAIGGTPMFLFNNKPMTREEIDEEYFETALKDIQTGYRHRMDGSYDKWYRCNHADEGAAYDAGVRMAAENPKCIKECLYIPCMS